MKNLSLFITSCALLFSTNSIAGSFLLNEYNLVTIEDINNPGSLHIDGTSLIGGDINVDQNGVLELGQRISSSSSQESLQLGGIYSGNSNTRGNTSITVDDNSNVVSTILENNVTARTTINGITTNEIGIDITRNAISAVQEQDLSGLSATIEENLTNASDAFKELEENSELTIDSNRSNFSTLTVDDSVSEDEYAVLSITSTDSIFTQSPNQQLEILSETFDNVAGIIINISGTAISNFQTIDFGSNNYSDVIYNFYEAVTITLSSNVYGSILAPLATLTSTSNVEGSVGVKSIGTGFRGEIHEFLTTVTPPSTETPTIEGPVEVSEPSTWLIFSGIAFVLLRLRKSKKA